MFALKVRFIPTLRTLLRPFVRSVPVYLHASFLR
uniref:Uncharacterized protein n=1 Tax=Rhizophora mucronata TaxID=61149 RepID=A0A2P2N7U2_RHIMU